MRKKLFTLLLAVAASVGTMFAEPVQIGDLYYNLDATNQTAEVTSQNSSYPYWSTTITAANIPSSVEYNSVTYSVTSIGNDAFSGCSGLTSVTIPGSVTSIGSYAFAGCSGLTSVTIGNSVKSIGESAFYGCSGLTSVTIPNSVTSIGNYAFYKCSGLTSVTIGNSVTSIGVYAFYKCSGLTSVTIPNSVTSIGDEAFDVCTGLTSVTIPNSVTSIGEAAFAYCTGLISIIVENGNSFYDSRNNCNAIIETATNTLIVGCKNTIIPNSVTSIGGAAFAGCSGLTSVTIPNSVTSIEKNAFAGCGLTSVTIPNSVTSIGESAFEGCTGLTSVTIPNSVTSIGDYAFYLCYGLTSVTIGNSVKSIGNSAFSYCNLLTSVTIPNSVTSIGDYAFLYCTGLTSVTNFANTPQEIGWSVFDQVDKSTCVLYVPAGSISAYKSAYQWKEFTNILPIGAQPADVTTTTVTPSATTADITWPQVTGAATYTIEIKKNGELICTLTFNAQGQLISIAFAAPSRNNAPQQAQAAGFSFMVTSLDSGTTYSYTMTAKDNNGNVLKTESGSFTTTGDAQGLEDVQGNNVQCTKVLHNGQILILRGEKAYTLTGQEVR